MAVTPEYKIILLTTAKLFTTSRRVFQNQFIPVTKVFSLPCFNRRTLLTFCRHVAD